MRKNFALIGVGGYIAPRHLAAIAQTGHRLIAACDPNDSVGILDRYFLDARYFPEFERFDRFLSKRRHSESERMHYLSVCTPNYLHDAHVRLSLRLGADAICEKPLVIKPWNLDQLVALEAETGSRVYTVMQLRLLPNLIALREAVQRGEHGSSVNVVLSYVTRRGPWYHTSWKGDLAKSGGLPTNIGIHFFDLLLWIFGAAQRCEVHEREADRWTGYLELERANVRWLLSTRYEDLPERSRNEGKPAFRSLTMDGVELEFSEGFVDLHVRVYEEVLAGRGFGIEDTRAAIELAHRIVSAPPTNAVDPDKRHPGTEPR